MSLFGEMPFQAAARELSAFATGRRIEIGVGFETNDAYDPGFFQGIEARGGGFTLRGPMTDTAYMFMVRPGSVTATSVQVFLGGWSNSWLPMDKWRRFTLVRMSNGAIKALNGWR